MEMAVRRLVIAVRGRHSAPVTKVSVWIVEIGVGTMRVSEVLLQCSLLSDRFLTLSCKVIIGLGRRVGSNEYDRGQSGDDGCAFHPEFSRV